MEIADRWAAGLQRAGRKEIGGVLFGEQIVEGDFRVVEATHQRHFGGTATTFNRRGKAARKKTLALHKKFGGDPERFNYLGEWHSHPSSPVFPSVQDEITMCDLIADQGGAVNFLVLAIVKLDIEARVQIGACAYLASGHRVDCLIEFEGVVSDASKPKMEKAEDRE